jgi:hypothetical protein
MFPLFLSMSLLELTVLCHRGCYGQLEGAIYLNEGCRRNGQRLQHGHSNVEASRRETWRANYVRGSNYLQREELDALERLFAELELCYKSPLYAQLRQLHKGIGVELLGGPIGVRQAARLLLDIAEDETDGGRLMRGRPLDIGSCVGGDGGVGGFVGAAHLLFQLLVVRLEIVRSEWVRRGEQADNHVGRVHKMYARLDVDEGVLRVPTAWAANWRRSGSATSE